MPPGMFHLLMIGTITALSRDPCKIMQDGLKTTATSTF